MRETAVSLTPRCEASAPVVMGCPRFSSFHKPARYSVIAGVSIGSDIGSPCLVSQNQPLAQTEFLSYPRHCHVTA